MIEKSKNPIIHQADTRRICPDMEEIEQHLSDMEEIERYLSDVKEAVQNDRYRLDRNPRRQDNLNLFLDYMIDEAKAKEVLLSLATTDFSEILQNEHKGFEHEKLYVFGKDVRLLRRFGREERTVSLYIKLNRLESSYVIVVSFHEQKYPLKYWFK